MGFAKWKRCDAGRQAFAAGKAGEWCVHGAMEWLENLLIALHAWEMRDLRA
jgi:hypothetical protein